MPEGDMIFRAARTLHRALSGHQVTRFETQLAHLARVNDDTPLAGRTVQKAEALGKWLLIHFSGDLILLTHMRMSGSWHIYRPGEKWMKPASQARAVIRTLKMVAVAFQVPVAEFHSSASLARRPGFRQLGPSVLTPDLERAKWDMIQRLSSRPELEIGSALLNQSLLAGIGNIFKSEICFVSRVNPFRTVGSLSAEELNCILKSARKLMSANIREGSHDGIATYTSLKTATQSGHSEDHLWVYHRGGKPCRVCGANIEWSRQGEEARSTYWCPKCQPLARAAHGA